MTRSIKAALSIFAIILFITTATLFLNGNSPFSTVLTNINHELSAQILQDTKTKLRKISFPTRNSTSIIIKKNDSPLHNIASTIFELRQSALSSIRTRPDNKKGIYLNAENSGNENLVDQALKKLTEANGSTIIFDVKGNGVYFDSHAAMATELGLVRNTYTLSTVLEKLHEKGIYAIGRFVSVKDQAFTNKKPDTKIRHPQNGTILSNDWIDPSNDEAIRYNTEIICELAASGIDEINLDYIRFSTAEFGALRIYSAEQKGDLLEKFIRAVRQTIDRCGPDTKLGLSTYAILGWSYDINVKTTGQDVVRFAPYIDVISPMAYPSTFTSAGYYNPGVNPGSRPYYLVYRTLTGYADLLGPEHSKKLRPWIQAYGMSSNQISDEIKGVYDAGYCGFTFWSAGNYYEATYAAMKQDNIRPEACTTEEAL
ncbi:MAG: putative glycoside hydrolase [bacterium]|nr:putative glycoside hydrolase [bacterium]